MAAGRKQRAGLELRRKKQALLALWNKLALELRGPHADENRANMYTAARLLELCQDHQGRFETRARKFLNESWRTYRHLGSFYRAWETLGDRSPGSGGRGRDSAREDFAKVQQASSVPEGVNWRGYVKTPEWWNDPKNLDPEAFKAKVRAIREGLRG